MKPKRQKRPRRPHLNLTIHEKTKSKAEDLASAEGRSISNIVESLIEDKHRELFGKHRQPAPNAASAPSTGSMSYRTTHHDLALISENPGTPSAFLSVKSRKPSSNSP